MRPILQVKELSKCYEAGLFSNSYRTLRDSLAGAMRGPFKSVRRNGNRSPETRWALRDVSFDVEPGEFVGIIGRNGAGKSTLLKILARITPPSAGRVELYGRVAGLLEIGTGFHPELSGRENVFLNGAILGMKKSEIERKFDEIVAFSEMEASIDMPVKWYSTGMYVRLAFAVAAHVEPEVLLVDEVLAVGDAAFQRKCMAKLIDVAGKGMTVLLVSHDNSAVAALCTRCLLIEEGRLKEDGNAVQVLSSYMSGLPTA